MFRAGTAFAALFLLAGAMSCRGFFVNPTLTGVTVTCPSCGSPTAPNLAASGSGNTAKLIATGNYDDSSTKNLTGTVAWSSSDATLVSVNNTNDKGRITAVTSLTSSPVTITATSSDGATAGSVPVTVGQANNVVTCSTGCTGGNTVSISSFTSVTFSASTSSTWISSNSTIMTVVGNGATATGTVTTNTGDVTITATPTTSGTAAGSLLIHVVN